MDFLGGTRISTEGTQMRKISDVNCLVHQCKTTEAVARVIHPHRNRWRPGTCQPHSGRTIPVNGNSARISDPSKRLFLRQA